MTNEDTKGHFKVNSGEMGVGSGGGKDANAKRFDNNTFQFGTELSSGTRTFKPAAPVFGGGTAG